MPATVRVKTRRRYPHRMPSIIKSVRSESPKLSYNFARRVAAIARARAPFDTGHLKSSIERKKVGRGAHEVRVGAHYGIYVEYGHRIVDRNGTFHGWQPAQPFFRPAIEIARQALRADIKKVVHR